jgi:tetratricopeptide (TPR) repeat protein
MVMPSPFDRLLQQAGQDAERDAHGTWLHLDELYGKSLTEHDVRNLAAFAAHLGGAGLGRWDETLAFLRRCLGHDGLDEGSDSTRSIWRAIAVIATCAGKEAEATDAIAAGVRNEAEHCRVLALTAQTLAARRRFEDAEKQLGLALRLLPRIPPADEVVKQLALIADNLAKVAEAHLGRVRELLLTATGATVACTAHLKDEANRHRALFKRGRALALAGKPAEALAAVQEMMALEAAGANDPYASFHSAALACQAQTVRGQFAIAEQALGACQQLAMQVPEDKRKELIALGKELKAELEGARKAVG